MSNPFVEKYGFVPVNNTENYQFGKNLRAPLALVKASPVGQLNTLKVAPAPATAMGRKASTANELKKSLWNAISGDGSTFYFNQTESRAVQLGKLISTAHRMTMFHTFTTGLLAARISMGINAYEKGKYFAGSATKLFKFTGAAAPAVQVGAVFGALCGLQAIKWSADLAINTVLDVKANEKRKRTLDLIKQYNPLTHKFVDPLTGKEFENAGLLKEMRGNISTPQKWYASGTGGMLARKKSQLVLDRLVTAREIYLRSSNAAGSLVNAVGFIPLATIFSQAAMSIVSTMKLGENVVALQNLKAAKVATDNDALKALCVHIKQERIYNARYDFGMASTYALSVAGNITASASLGVAAVPMSLVSGAGMTGVVMAGNYFTLVHARTIGKRREANKKQYQEWKANIPKNNPFQKTQYLRALRDKKNIGLAEQYAVDMLRHGTAREVKEAYQFMRNLGLARVTVIAIQNYESDDVALQKFIAQAYTDRMKYRWRNTRHFGNVLNHFCGFSYMSKWAKTRLEHRRQTSLQKVSSHFGSKSALLR